MNDAVETICHQQKDENFPEIDELSHETARLSVRGNQVTPPKLCIFYSKKGYCRYDSSCKFLHSQRRATAECMRSEFLNQNYTRKYMPSTTRAISNSGRKLNASQRHCDYFKTGHYFNSETSNNNHSSLRTAVNSVKFPTHSSSFKKRPMPVCYFFKRGICHNGDNCKYYHEQKFTAGKNSDVSASLNSTLPQINNLIDINKINSNGIQDVSTLLNTHSEEILYCPSNCNSNAIIANIMQTSETSHSSENLPYSVSDNPNVVTGNVFPIKEDKVPIYPVKIFDLFSLSENEILKLRDTEVIQLKKRFPGLEVIVENITFVFEFQPSDPDLPIQDKKNLRLQVTFPEKYPLEVCRINVLQSPNSISETHLSHLNESVLDWLNQRHKSFIECNKVELLFRPFLRWFDKTLSELFNSRFKMIEQAVFAEMDDIELDKTHLSLSETDVEENFKIFENELSLPANQITTEFQAQTRNETYRTNSSGPLKTSTMSLYRAQKLGINIMFMGLELIEGIGAISCKKLAIMLHCDRCKTSCNVNIAPNKENSIICSNCRKFMKCNFKPSILHQYTNILGTVYLGECQGVYINLMECAFLVDCLNCSKQVPVQGICYGSKQKFRCNSCNQQLLISIESSKFQALKAVKTAPVKKPERTKDTSIKEGSPLPQFGACKHYKKSNRWLRFPCCRRVYPCDICHDDKEIDHDMKFATRMICGFCSKEQPYSKDKPCSSCSSNVVAKSGTHWEGGKGCRNKIKMARGDKKKYAGSSKTTPKKVSLNSVKKKC